MTEDDYTRGAEQELVRYLERERELRVASDILSTAFRDGEIDVPVDAGAASGNEADAEDVESAKASARAYAEARNHGARFRHYNDHNESAQEGIASALDWISRKRRSVIRK